MLGGEMIDISSKGKINLAGPLLTVTEVAKLLHVHNNTARRWADAGIIQAYRISRRGDRRFRQADILQFLTDMSKNNGFLNTK
jgi:excisionase family DNA binding protein